ncbi:cysteine desulfurase family protein [Cohnella suwonensis]|uniref:Cysteine desulfurase family protein n=1 Tax=Cohnella suwonensis TaxID=696072 RepID=A0ABW0LMK0_9BACL
MKTYYFDHSASAPMWPKVVDTMTELMKLHYSNASSLHRSGIEASKLAERARASVAERMGAMPQEVVFTSGGTESNNLALKGLVGISARATKHIVVSAIEHASVFECARQLEAQGVQLTIVPVDREGRVDVAEVVKAIRKNTVLVSVMHVNNETGGVQPIGEIARALAEHPHVKFHVDGVQAIGKVPFSFAESGVHLYSGSAHKFGGPKGTGFLLVKEGVELAPLFGGGSHEHGLRAGTTNVPAVVAMSQALRLSLESLDDRRLRMFGLRRKLRDIVEGIPELLWNGIGVDPDRENDTAPHVVNISYPGMRPEVLIHMMEENGILLSTQSACSSKSLKPSRVLLAMGHDADRASGGIRISFGDEHEANDLDELGERLKQAISQLKALEKRSRPG